MSSANGAIREADLGTCRIRDELAGEGAREPCGIGGEERAKFVHFLESTAIGHLAGAIHGGAEMIFDAFAVDDLPLVIGATPRG